MLVRGGYRLAGGWTRALIQRINRKLRHDCEMLKTARSPRVASNLGWYYILDWRRNLVLNTRINQRAAGVGSRGGLG
jgi:hypothetical protein